MLFFTKICKSVFDNNELSQAIFLRFLKLSNPLIVIFLLFLIFKYSRLVSDLMPVVSYIYIFF